MTYDDDYEERRPVPTLRSVMRDFGAVLARPVVSRCTRARRWIVKLYPYRSDAARRRQREAAVYTVSVPLQFSMPDPWRPWARWYPGFDMHSVLDAMPLVSAVRGGITFQQGETDA